jgi:hypothetical protein
MRKFFATLNLFLCFELIVGPVVPQLSLFGKKAFAEECAPGLHMDPVLNRCLTSTQSANIMNATSSCAADDHKCYRANAESALAQGVASGDIKKEKKNLTYASKVNVAAVAIPITLAVKGLKHAKTKGKCASASYWALIGGGVSLFTGDMLANMKHKKRLKEIKKDWDKIVKPDAAGEKDQDQQRINATEAQSQAFEMLARSEDSMEKTAKTKRIFFGVAMGAFAAGAALAVIEGMTPATATMTGICAPTASMKVDPKMQQQKIYNINQAKNFAEFYTLNLEMNSDYSSPSLEEYERIKKFTDGINIDDHGILSWVKEITVKALTEMNPLPSAVAQGWGNSSSAGSERDQISSANEITPQGNTSMTGLGSADIGTKALSNKIQVNNVATQPSSNVGKFLTSPWTRAAFGALLSSWSYIMFKHAGSQAEASRNRADKLREMKEEFVSASGAIHSCAPADRNDPSRPNCYCYTPEGKRNPNRNNSGVCQKLFTGVSTKAGNYYGQNADKIMGCIDNSRGFDESCKCRQTKSCMKLNQGSFAGINPGTLSMLSSGLTPAAQQANGNFDSANANAGSLANNAMKIMDATKKLEAKAGKDFKSKKDKASLGIEQSLSRGGAGMSGGNLLGSSSSLGLPSNPGEAARMLEKEIENNSPVSTFGGGDTIAGPSNSGNNPDFEFGLSPDQLSNQETQLAEVMKENLDYGSNDINQGSKTNIFEVLSNRYQRSGMRRLFDEKGVTTPDKPSETEITQ